MASENELAEKIIELEHKIAFQELAIEELNTILIAQQQILNKLNLKYQHLDGKLESIQTSANLASFNEEEKPPHY